jgi:hypothetical protein
MIGAFVPLKEDCVESCLDRVATDITENPGENAFGTGTAPPFLLRPGRDELLQAT